MVHPTRTPGALFATAANWRALRTIKQSVTLRAIEPLWVPGMGLALLFTNYRVLPWHGKTFEWAQYLMFGLLFPALTVALAWLPGRLASGASRLVLTVRLALAALCLLFCIHTCFSQAHFNRYLILLSLSGMVMLWQLCWRGQSRRPGIWDILCYALVLLAAWTAAVKISWFNPVEDWTKLRRLPAFLVLYFVLSNTGWARCPERRKTSFKTASQQGHVLTTPTIVNVVALIDVVALCIFGLASVRYDVLFTPQVVHHWGFYVGPAQLVRQGGWLLWDVPSQYGLLNILLLAWMPFKSPWQALYVLNALLLWVAAGLCDLVLRLSRPGWANACFGLIMTVCGLFLAGGHIPGLTGPQMLPSTGPMRFFWCYPLLAILAWHFHKHACRGEFVARATPATGHGAGDHSAASARRLAMGCCAWLCGTLWSVESAIYCTCIWLPAYMLLACHQVASAPPQSSDTSARQPPPSRRLLGWLLLPPGLAVGAWLGVALLFHWRLGHPPDWSCFYEYSLSYTGGFATIPIDRQGIVWALILVACSLVTVPAYLQSSRWNLPSWSLALGAWGAAWATSSYFVVRPYPYAVSSISPILVMSGACILLLVARIETPLPQGQTRQALAGQTSHPQVPAHSVPPADSWIAFVRLALGAVYAVLILIPITYPGPILHDFVSSLGHGYNPHVEHKLPVIDPALAALFGRAAVKPSDALCLVGQSPIPAWSFDRPHTAQDVTVVPQWVPASPLVILAPLPPPRRQVYMARFAARAHLSGWLVRARGASRPNWWYTSAVWFHDLDWLYDQIHRTHRATRRFENSRWTLTWYQYRDEAGEPGAASRPASRPPARFPNHD